MIGVENLRIGEDFKFGLYQWLHPNLFMAKFVGSISNF